MLFLLFLILVNSCCFGSSTVKSVLDFGASAASKSLEFGVVVKDYIKGIFVTTDPKDKVIEKYAGIIFNPRIGVQSVEYKKALAVASSIEKPIIINYKQKALKIKDDSQYEKIYLYPEAVESKDRVALLKKSDVREDKILYLTLKELIDFTEQVKGYFADIIDNPYLESSREKMREVENLSQDVKQAIYKFVKKILDRLIIDKIKSIENGYQLVIDDPLSSKSLYVLSRFDPLSFEYITIMNAIAKNGKYKVSDVEDKIYDKSVSKVALDDSKDLGSVEDKLVASDVDQGIDDSRTSIDVQPKIKEDVKSAITKEVNSYNNAVKMENKKLIEREIKSAFPSKGSDDKNIVDSLIEKSFANTGKIDANLIAEEMIESSPDLKYKYNSITDSDQRKNFKDNIASSLEKPLALKQKALESGNWNNSEFKDLYSSNVESGVFEKGSDLFKESVSSSNSRNFIQYDHNDKKKNEKKEKEPLNSDEKEKVAENIELQVLFGKKGGNIKKTGSLRNNRKTIVKADKKDVKKNIKDDVNGKKTIGARRKYVYI
jgi:hypothetical protein